MPAGRKTKYTPETVKKIIDAMSVGMTDRDACIVSGISEDTLARWRSQHTDFAERSTRAREEGWQSALAVIKYAAISGRDYKAAGDYLDRTRSAYKKSTESVLANPDGGPLEILITRHTKAAS